MSGTNIQQNAVHSPMKSTLNEAAVIVVDETDKKPPNALFEAIICGDENLVHLLVERGEALVNARDPFGRTPLFYAITKSKEIAEYLIKKGADVTLKDFSNRNILSFFVENCLYENKFPLSSLISEKKEEFKMFKDPSKNNKHFIKTILGILFCKLPLMCASSTKIPDDKTRKLNQEMIGNFTENFGTILRVARDHFSERDTELDKEKKTALDGILKDFEEKKTFSIVYDGVVALLVESIGADHHFIDSDGNSALHYAASLPFLGVSTDAVMSLLRQLEKYGLMLNTRNHEDQTPLLFCLSQSMRHLKEEDKVTAMETLVEVCQFLVTRGSSLDEQTRSGESVFHLVMELFQQGFEIPDEAVRQSVTDEALKLLNLLSADRLNKGTTVNKRNSHLNSPLHDWATLTLQYSSSVLFEATLKEILEHLLKLGATLNPRNGKEETPLHRCKTWSAVKLLLHSGADPKVVDSSGRSPILAAANNKTFLIKPGCFYPDVSENPEKFWKSVNDKRLNVQATDKHDNSVVNVLVESKAYQLAMPILDKDYIDTHSDFINIADSEGKTALFYAVQQSTNENVVHALIDAGAADVNRTDKKGKTALFYAVQQSTNKGVVRTLIDAGADVKLTDEERKALVRCCLHFALEGCLKLNDDQQLICLYKECLSLAYQLEDVLTVMNSSLLLGLLHERMCLFKEAFLYYQTVLEIAASTDSIRYYEEALREVRQLEDKKNEGKICLNKNNVYLSLCRAAIKYHKKKLAIAMQTGNENEMMCAHFNIGLAYLDVGEYHDGIHHLQESLTKAIQFNDKEVKGVIYMKLTHTYEYLGQFQESIKFEEKGLEITLELEEKRTAMKAYERLGEANLKLGKFTKALENFKKSRSIALELSDKEEEGRCCVNIGDVYFETGEYDEAIKYYKKGEGIAITTANKQLEGRVYNNLGNVYYFTSKYELAEEYYKKSLKNNQVIDDKKREGQIAMNLGNVYFSLGKYQEAIEHHEKAVSIAMEVGDRNGEAAALVNLAKVLCTTGKYHESIKYSLKGLDISLEIKDKKPEATACMNLASAYLLLGRYTEAERHVKMAVKIAKEISDKRIKGTSYIIYGNVLLSLAKFQEAIKRYEESLDITREIGDKNGEGLAYMNLGNTYLYLKESDRAIKYYQLSLKVAQEIGNKKLEESIYFNLGIAHFSKCNYQEAFRSLNMSLVNLAIKMSYDQSETKDSHSLDNLCHELSGKHKKTNFKQKSISYMKQSTLQSWEWVIKYFLRGSDISISTIIRRFINKCRMPENKQTALMIYQVKKLMPYITISLVP